MCSDGVGGEGGADGHDRRCAVTGWVERVGQMDMTEGVQ